MSKVLGYGRPDFPVKQPENMCPDCLGHGYTADTAPVVKRLPNTEGLTTVALGSGCKTCKGVGHVK